VVDPAVRIAELEEEVRRLKRELATRGPSEQRATVQARRDAILRAIQQHPAE
jgi:uncharacterized small protein (DUF1192 family)